MGWQVDFTDIEKKYNEYFLYVNDPIKTSRDGFKKKMIGCELYIKEKNMQSYTFCEKINIMWPVVVEYLRLISKAQKEKSFVENVIQISLVRVNADNWSIFIHPIQKNRACYRQVWSYVCTLRGKITSKEPYEEPVLIQ